MSCKIEVAPENDERHAYNSGGVSHKASQGLGDKVLFLAVLALYCGKLVIKGREPVGAYPEQDKGKKALELRKCAVKGKITEISAESKTPQGYDIAKYSEKHSLFHKHHRK